VKPLAPITEPPSATVTPAPAPRSVPPSDEARTPDLTAPREATASPGVPSGAALGAPSLPAERALLDIAHTALANGEATEALDALGQHAKKFPRGVYREEREALTIKALRSLGRSDEAARRAAAFTTRYPNSLFRAIVEASPGSNP
jgi:TolA-binding protein